MQKNAPVPHGYESAKKLPVPMGWSVQGLHGLGARSVPAPTTGGNGDEIAGVIGPKLEQNVAQTGSFIA